MREYTEEEKAKYCHGFKNCTLPITDYAEKMKLDVEKLKQWIKEYRKIRTMHIATSRHRDNRDVVGCRRIS